MKKIGVFVIVFLSLASSSNCQSFYNRDVFFSKISSLGLSFTQSRDYKEVKIDTSKGIAYDYALSDPQNLCEIRYKIIPIATKQINPNLFFKSNVVGFCFDLTKDLKVKLHDFPSDAVKNDFNADFGLEGYLVPKVPFANGFKNIYIISYYKTGRAIIYVFYLFNVFKQPEFGRIVKESYKAIRFFEKIENNTNKIVSPPMQNISPTNFTNHLKFYKDSLHLSDEKANSLMAIDKKYSNLAAEIKFDSSVAAKEKISKLLSLSGKKRKEVNNLLGDQDFSKWNEWQKKQFHTSMMKNGN